MPVQETFHGFIETTTDALLVFEACRRGILPKITRRLQERERGAIRSGTVFVFDEKESGIKRWTDGIVWSPSRILGNFLVYRELDGRESLQDDNNNKQEQQYMNGDDDDDDDDDDECNMTVEDRNRERALVGSLTDTYRFKRHGLIKKTISIHVNGSYQHLVSYYTKKSVLEKTLATPCSIPEIGSIRISPELLLRQSFRVSPSVEYNDKVLGNNNNNNNNNNKSGSNHSSRGHSKQSSLSSPVSTHSTASTCSINTTMSKKNNTVMHHGYLIDEHSTTLSTRRRTSESIESYNHPPSPLSRKVARLSMDLSSANSNNNNNNNKNHFIESNTMGQVEYDISSPMSTEGISSSSSSHSRFDEDVQSAFKIVKQIDYLPPQQQQQQQQSIEHQKNMYHFIGSQNNNNNNNNREDVERILAPPPMLWSPLQQQQQQQQQQTTARKYAFKPVLISGYHPHNTKYSATCIDQTKSTFGVADFQNNSFPHHH